MHNKDKRIQRALDDPKFATLVKSIEAMFYHDSGITYGEMLDAVFVARSKYESMNPTVQMILPEILPQETMDQMMARYGK
jgi:hypothetical protein